MSAWAKLAAERIRDANDRSVNRRGWWLFRRNEIIAHGERVWHSIVRECQREADCFNAALEVPHHPDAIQPFDTGIPFTVVIRQLNFPETRVQCSIDREAREIVVTWFRKASHASAETHDSEILELDVSEETGEVFVSLAGTPLTTNQVAEVILTPLMNKRQWPSVSCLAS
ncbi:MAG: hypothetical protein LAO77_15950 [Acidobacteriia bacterium]|nr:hypothetical protein [Terriglobia bacterium]